MSTEQVVKLNDHVEASAYAVLMISMLKTQEKDPADYLGGIAFQEGSWCVMLSQPLPPMIHEAIIHGIAYDQKKNPAKWEQARLDTKMKGATDEVH